MRNAVTRSAVALALVIAAACGGSPPPPVAAPPPPAASAAPEASTSAAMAPPSAPPTQEEAHKLAILATSCWFGGVWADALGEQDQVKLAGIDNRCHDLERRVWSTDDKIKYEQMRAFEQNSLSDVIARVDLASRGDAVDGPRSAALVKLTAAIADALHETMEARRAGDRVKRDLDREPEKLSADETSAVTPLRAHAKLEALLKLDAGDLTKEAHAIGLLCALDRVEVARGLPKHLKLYAVADTFALLFGVAIPDVPSDATKKLVPGTWLKFLGDTAAAAGHPVSDKAKTPRDKDALAWAGMQQGFGEKLAADAGGIATTTDLAKVVTAVLHRLETEYAAQQAAEATKEQSPAKPPKKSK